MSINGRRAFLATLAGEAAAIGLGAYGLRALLSSGRAQTQSSSALKLIPPEAAAQHLPSRDEFAQQLHSTFSIQAPASAPVDVELIEVSETKTQPAMGAQLETFTLLFKAPKNASAEQIFSLKHPKLPASEVFMSSVGKHKDCTIYQAVFTRFV